MQNLKTTHFVFARLPAIDTLTNWNSSLGKKGSLGQDGTTSNHHPQKYLTGDHNCKWAEMCKKNVQTQKASNVQENLPTSPSGDQFRLSGQHDSYMRLWKYFWKDGSFSTILYQILLYPSLWTQWLKIKERLIHLRIQTLPKIAPKMQWFMANWRVAFKEKKKWKVKTMPPWWPLDRQTAPHPVQKDPLANI